MTPSARITDLSYDVADQILHGLCSEGGDTRDDIQNLAACRLVSQSFNYMALPRLFKTIYLGRRKQTDNRARTPKPEVRAQALLGIIEQNPAIANFIYNFHLHTYKYWCKGGLYHWITASNVLLELFPKLVNVKHFALEAHEGTLIWVELGTPVANAIHDTVNRPTLSSFQVLNVMHLPLTKLLHRKARTGPRMWSEEVMEPGTPHPLLDTLVLLAYTLWQPSPKASSVKSITGSFFNTTELASSNGTARHRGSKFYFPEGTRTSSIIALLSTLPLKSLFIDLGENMDQLIVGYTDPESRPWDSEKRRVDVDCPVSTFPLGNAESFTFYTQACCDWGNNSNVLFNFPQKVAQFLQCPGPESVVNVRFIHLKLNVTSVAESPNYTWNISGQWGTILKQIISDHQRYPKLHTLTIEFVDEKTVMSYKLDTFNNFKDTIRDILSGLPTSIYVKVVIPTLPEFYI